MRSLRLAFLLLAFQLQALSQQPGYQSITVENGLLNNMVLCATQDGKGFMWFATISGIDRYDGNSFTHFKLPFDGDQSYEFMQVIWISADTSGSVWAATKNELFFFDPKKKIFTRKYSFASGGRASQANTFFIDRDNDIWIQCTTGLFIYSIADGSLSEINRIPSLAGCLSQDRRGIIWAAQNAAIRCYRKTGKKISAFPVPFTSAAGKDKFEISSLYVDRTDQVWIGTRENGVYVYDQANRRWLNSSAVNRLISNTAIRSITRWSQTDQILIATDGQGLFRLDSDLSVQGHDNYFPDEPESLSSNAIYNIYEDSFNRIWLSTYGGGINFTPDKPPFQTFNHVLNNPRSLHNNMARCSVTDESGRIWFGTSKGISIYDPGRNRWEYLSLGKDGTYSNGLNVLTLLNSGDGYIWAGTYGEGLKKIRTGDRRVVANYSAESGPDEYRIGTNYVFCLYQDRQRQIWTAGIRGDVSVIARDGKIGGRFPLRDLHAITEDHSGNMLLAGTNGLFRINRIQKDIVRLFPDSTGGRMLFYAMCRLRDGEVALGTNGAGLIIYSIEQNKVISHYTEKDGLPSNFVAGVLQDENGRLWISTTNGLSCLYGNDRTFMNYTHADGLPGNQFNSRAYYKTPSGQMIFGSTNGFVLFDPKDFERKIYPSRLVFTDLKLAHQRIVAGQENGILQTDIDEAEGLELANHQQSFSLDFINISPQGAEKNLYSWKLEGFDTSWSPVSRLSTASYTNLDPGTYMLRVRSFNNGLFNKGNERSIRIHIRQPWYRTNLAYLCYFLAVVLLAFVLRKAISISIARKRYKEQVRFFAHIAHDLRTPLTLISSPIHSLLRKNALTGEDKTALELAERNANRLNRLVTQLLDFQKADFKKMHLQVARYDIKRLLEKLLDSFKPLLEEKKLQLDFKAGSGELYAWIDHDKFEKIIYNLISNAIKYSNADGRITVRLAAAEQESYTISIADTGIGIPEKQQPYIFHQYYRANNTANLQETGSGLGLVLSKLLVELHKGSIVFKSKAGEGSVFRIILPLGDVFTPEEKLTEDLTKHHSASGHAASPGGKKKDRILVVEDNNDLRQYLYDQLSEQYTVMVASDGREALQIVKEHDFGLVVSDIMMPEMDGYTLCSTLKREAATCHIPVILLTAIHDHDYRLEGMDAGADDYVEKPFNVEYLKSRIDNLLRTRKILKQKFFTTIDTSGIRADHSADELFVQQAIGIVTERLGDGSFTVEDLCTSLAVSRPVLFRRIKALTGLAPQDFIRNIRLKKAAELLLTKKHSVSEISVLTGFSDAKYFSTSFKKKFGQTPSDYGRN